MKTLILNGALEPDGSGLDQWVVRYQERLAERDDRVETIALKDLGLKTCTGCWSCWWATPGSCVLKDGMQALYPRILEAQRIVWAVPLVLGVQNALVKKAQDRMVPLVHPYIEVVDGECHHRKRYKNYPAHVLIVEGGEAGGSESPEDLALVRSLFERFALNFRSKLVYFSTTAKKPEEAADETLSA
jgi:multimeric flavodoxin WrbA